MGAVLEYTAAFEDTGKSVETVWKQKFGISAGLFVNLKLNGKLKLNGNICRSIDTVSQNDILTADVTENEVSENIVPADIPIDIIYEDDFIAVINKPRRMSVHPSIGHFEDTLANALMYHWQKRGEMHKFHAVNRIDKDTSGVCVVAKNRFSHGILSAEMKNGDFTRKYYAAVHGAMSEKSGTIDIPIKREQESVIKRIASPDGKRAVTHYKVVQETDKYTLVEVYLETGRTHQIRVHFSYLGHPLIGDWLYGDKEADKSFEEAQLLHAYNAEFYHPATKEFMKFDIPLPPDMSNIFCKKG